MFKLLIIFFSIILCMTKEILSKIYFIKILILIVITERVEFTNESTFGNVE